jgi:hypothetical protein
LVCYITLLPWGAHLAAACWRLLQVDRVLAERRGPARSGGGEVAQYLVAWQQLPLEQASWEDEPVSGSEEGVLRLLLSWQHMFNARNGAQQRQLA